MSRRSRDAVDELWTQHADIIRQLYEVNRASLKSVKCTMEENYNFPIFPLSTYERKLRDGLGLRKKLKKGHWPIIKELFQIRDTQGKKTAVYLNGTVMDPRKVWKEIRRSGNSEIYHGHKSPQPLPSSISVRTPSPVPQYTSTVAPGYSSGSPPPSPTAMLLQSSSWPSFFERRKLAIISDSLLLSPYNGPLPEETWDEYQGWVHRLCLESIPVRLLLIKVDHILAHDFQNSNMPGNSHLQETIMRSAETLNSSFHERLSQKSRASLPFYFSLVPSNLSAVSNFESYYFITNFIYLLSNDLYNLNDISILESIGNRIPRAILVELFAVDTPSVRAAWHKLVMLAGRHSRRDAFLMLMAIGFHHHEWQPSELNQFLYLAASMNCIRTVQDLLKAGARPEKSVDRRSAILEALAADYLECARILLDATDINCIIDACSSAFFVKTSCFGHFLCHLGFQFPYDPLVAGYGHHRIKGPGFIFNLDNDVHRCGLELFLERGANVDIPFGSTWNFDTISVLYDQNYESDVHRATFVDWCYYWDETLFQMVVEKSRSPITDMTRFGICLAAGQSKEALQRYLQSRSPQTPDASTKFLQLVLAEQFVLHELCGSIDTSAIIGLVDYGVDISLPTLKQDINFLLLQLVKFAREDDLSQDIANILTLFFQCGASADKNILASAVPTKGLSLMPLLVAHAPNITQDGATAMAIAAKFNNFAVVDLLLQHGVDINADILTDEVGLRSIVAVAIDPRRLSASGVRCYLGGLLHTPTLEMLVYLIAKGAKLRLNQNQPDQILFLETVLHRLPRDKSAVNKVNLFLSTGISLVKASGTLLESSLLPTGAVVEKDRHHTLALFELLYRRGAPIQPGSPLAVLIHQWGSSELIQELLDAGADVNAYSAGISRCLTPLQAAALRGNRELVCKLLHSGAQINAPAHRSCGITALQAACEYQPSSTKERMSKLNLIRLLIDQGADVNAAAAYSFGGTALQMAAACGDIEAALLLLSHQADVNAPPSPQGERLCALDAAADQGRLDMVKLLLNENALSYDQGTTGYDGAITRAQNRGHSTVAGLIAKHAADNIKYSTVHPTVLNRENVRRAPG